MEEAFGRGQTVSNLLEWQKMLKPLFAESDQPENIDRESFRAQLSEILHPDIGDGFMRLAAEKQISFIKDLKNLTYLDINAKPDDLRTIYASLAQRCEELFTWADDPDPSW
jgi:hypothetical protein